MFSLIYTAGYRGRTPKALCALAESLHATVVDIRYQPHSPNPVWRPDAMRATLGPRYHWLQSLGNVNYNKPVYVLSDRIKIADPVRGVECVERLAARGTVILLCACEEYAACHRATVADLLRARGHTVEEVVW